MVCLYLGSLFGQALGVGDGQGSLQCCSPRGCKESDRTEQLNTTELHFIHSTVPGNGIRVPHKAEATPTLPELTV